MAAMFYMASVFFYLKARLTSQNQKINARGKHSLTFPPGLAVRTGYILSGLCGVLALLSKQSAASLPGAVLLIEYLLINRAWAGWKKMIPWFAFSFTLWIIFVFYVLGVFSSEINSGTLSEDISNLARVQEVTVSRWQYLCTQFNVLVIYIRMLFLPINQCFDYLYPYKDGFLDDYTPMAFSFLAGLVAIGMWGIRKRPVISLAVFWFFITLSVESSILPLYAYFEHRLYLSMFGFAIFVTWFLFHLFPEDTPHRLSWVIASNIVIILLLGMTTYHRNGVWQDEMKLWSDTVTKSPKNHRAHDNLAIILSQQDKPVEAMFHYKESLRLNPKYANAHYNLGEFLLQQDKIEEAIFHYKEALSINPDYVDANYNLGNVLVRDGKYDEAIFHYRKALRGNSDNADIHNNIGVVLYEQKKYDEAIGHYFEALRVDPDYADAHNNLGVALEHNEKYKDAISHYKEALRLNPDHVDAHYNLGNAYFILEKYDKATFHYEETLRTNPNNIKARKKLGVILSRQGSYNSAITHFSTVIRINPNDADVHYNLALALDMLGQIENSITEYHEALKFGPNMLEALDNLAWIFATSKNPEFRNAAEAVKLADKACGLTAHKQPLMLDTLAAAYAEARRFDDALKNGPTSNGDSIL